MASVTLLASGSVTSPMPRDDILIRVGFLVSSNLVRNGAEKIAFVQLGIMLVQFHLSLPLHFNMIL